MGGYRDVSKVRDLQAKEALNRGEVLSVREARNIVMRFDNSAGADYFGGVETAGEPHSLFYGDKEKGYDLATQAASTYHIFNQVTDPSSTDRERIANSYAGEAANYHDLACWYEADVRDRLSQEQFGKPWLELSKTEKSSEQGIDIDTRAKDIRYEADSAFIKSMLEWKPETNIGKAYREMAVQGFTFSILTDLGKEHYDRLMAQSAELREISQDMPKSIVNGTVPGAIARGVALINTDMEKLTTLPISEREMGFFNQHLKHLGNLEGMTPYPQNRNNSEPPRWDTLVVPKWTPNPDYPINQPGAQNHGQYVWQGKLDDKQVSMVLDMDNGRTFTHQTTDSRGNVVEKVYAPTSELTRDNFFTPSYDVTTTLNGEQIAQSELKAGPTYTPPSQYQGRLYTDSVEQMRRLAETPEVQTVLHDVALNIEHQRLNNREDAAQTGWRSVWERGESLDNYPAKLAERHPEAQAREIASAPTEPEKTAPMLTALQQQQNGVLDKLIAPKLKGNGLNDQQIENIKAGCLLKLDKEMPGKELAFAGIDPRTGLVVMGSSNLRDVSTAKIEQFKDAPTDETMQQLTQQIEQSQQQNREPHHRSGPSL